MKEWRVSGRFRREGRPRTPHETPSPSLDEVIAQLRAVNDEGKVDEYIKIISDVFQWRTAGKSLEEKAESSQSVASRFIGSGETFFNFLTDHIEKSSNESSEAKAENSRSVTSRFIGRATACLKCLTDHVEKSSNKKDFVSSASQIIGDVLEKLGNKHSLVVGLSVIAYMLHTAEPMSENYKRCLDLLQKLIDLSDQVKKLDCHVGNHEEKLKRVIVVIVKGCILCASHMASHKLSRFWRAFVNADALENLDREIDYSLKDLISTAVEQAPEEESKYVGEDVFLSHSGVQKDFVRQLHRDLTREGVPCFFDESRQCLPLAEKWAPRIFEEAESCRVAVLLLSRDFIQSRWPMLELSAFLKAKDSGKNPNLKILPLFFKISPGDLKKDIPDWTRLEISEETRIEWKEALREVRKINGLRFNEGGDEVRFRDEIIEEIRTLLPPSPIVSMPVGSIGLAERQEEVIELLQLTSLDKPRMAVVMYGFGGIGKTTLAEAVVAKIDLKSYHYARVDFNIDSSNNDIKSMQDQIINGLFPSRTETITSCYHGRTLLTEAFQKKGNKPIFLFIDNARKKQDLHELLPRDMKGLPKGSRILVTTRDLGATDLFIEIEAGLERQQYHVQPLPDQQAKKFLLKGLADRQLENIPKEDVERILKICQGVPLVMKIIRGHFQKQGYRADKCSDIVQALETGQDIKEEDLSRTLTDSVYEQLEESSQQAFLDICCFFNDINPFYVECIVGPQALTSLEEAAFVQRSDDKKTLIIHDIIRERGRNKAESTRIMNLKSLIDAANEQRLKDIRGVWLKDEADNEAEEVESDDEADDEAEEDESEDEADDEPEEDEPEYVVEHLKAMKKLRVLALGKHMRVSQRCEVTFKELRYLEVGGDIPRLPVNLGRLPKLKFYEGPLFKKDFGMYKLPEELRVLIVAPQSDFSESTYSEESTSIRALNVSSLKALDLSKLKDLQKVPQGLHLHLLTSLEILSWTGWDRMEVLPEEVCQLTMLTKLTLSRWTSLTCLPGGFGRLTALKGLNLSSCTALECLPESLGKLKALKDLNLCGCGALKLLPESFGQLKALVSLCLNGCEALKRLPESFGQLKALKDLQFSHCTALERLPESFGELESLKDLELSDCTALERLPETFGQLKALELLNLSGCKVLQRLPESFGQLKALKDLYLKFCGALESLPKSFGQLKALKDLQLYDCTALKHLPESFGQLKALKDLELSDCTALEHLPESFGQLKALASLNLDCCRALESLPESFGELKGLKDLQLSECEALERLPESFGELKALVSLNLNECEALERLPESFGELKALVSLNLNECEALERLPESFGELKALVSLNLNECEALERLPESFGQLKALKDLNLGFCKASESLSESLGQFKAMELLNLSGFKASESLGESFGELTALKDLELEFCEALQSLPQSFGQLKALKDLKLSSCTALQSLPQSFGQLKALKDLKLSSCTALESLPESFGELKAIESLHFSRCKALERLPESFGKLKALIHLDLSHCKALERFPESFGELEALETLIFSHCKALERLPESFGKLKALIHLDLSTCKALERLPESFGKLKALQTLLFSHCKALERLPESFGKLKALIHLDLSHCKALESLPESFGQLTSLQDIMIAGCPARANLRQFEANLKYVTIYEDEDEDENQDQEEDEVVEVWYFRKATAFIRPFCSSRSLYRC